MEQIEKFDDPRSDDEEDDGGVKLGGGLGGKLIKISLKLTCKYILFARKTT